MKISHPVNSIVLWSFFILFSENLWALPDSNTQNVNKIPNICQTCFPKLIDWGGKPHCAPAAISNSLVWLASLGLSELQPFQGKDHNLSQAQLVQKLGLMMETDSESGTSPYRALNGLKKYLDERKVKFKRLAGAGWRDLPDFAVKDQQQTTLQWIQEGTLKKNSVWILIGWFRYEEKTDSYTIFDGHWMTVVGYGKDRKGQLNKNIIILHDPAERAERIAYYATVTALKHGTLLGREKKYYPRTATGELSLTGDYIMKPTASHGLIQGAYRLEIE